jgi:LmbE family N-acetylglucosaminyl deacetylase
MNNEKASVGEAQSVASQRCVLAIAAHPDDIEFYMAGTLLLLRQRGWQAHYLNIGDGCCGTEAIPRDEIIRIRREESRAAAQRLGAVYHESLAHDLEIFYNHELLTRVAAIVRQAAPDIVLTQSPSDYMEDHQNACRLAVSAAFAKGMRNYAVVPAQAPIRKDITVYHATPHSHRDALRRAVRSGLYVDIGTVMDAKAELLACHRSQKDWLDASQGMGCYIETMRGLAAETGQLSGRYAYAEGWRRHAHWGFSAAEVDPLREALADVCGIDERYERELDIGER